MIVSIYSHEGFNIQLQLSNPKNIKNYVRTGFGEHNIVNVKLDYGEKRFE